MGKRRGASGGPSATEPTSIPVSSIAFNPRNPSERQTVSEEFVRSIELYGIQQPITVVRYELFLARFPDLEDSIGTAHWVAIQGNRRLAGAQKAELEEIPVRVSTTLAREDRLDEAVLIENVHRQDLAPLQEALLVSNLVDKHGSKTAVAEALAKSNGWVSQRLSLLKLDPVLQSKLAAKELTVEAARDLASLPSLQQVEAWEAGPPYKEKRTRKPAVADGATVGDPDTYARTDLPPAGETTTRLKQQAAREQANSESKTSATVPAVDFGSAEASPKPDSVPSSGGEFYGVKPGAVSAPDVEPEPAVNGSEPGEVFYGVKPDGELVRTLTRRTSADVAAAVRAALPPEHVSEVALLLRNV